MNKPEKPSKMAFLVCSACGFKSLIGSSMSFSDLSGVVTAAINNNWQVKYGDTDYLVCPECGTFIDWKDVVKKPKIY